MPQKSKTPADEAGASRDSFAGLSRRLFNLEAQLAQFPILTLHCGPDWLAILAAAALEGGRA